MGSIISGDEPEGAVEKVCGLTGGVQILRRYAAFFR
jgi:hypothetical protein